MELLLLGLIIAVATGGGASAADQPQSHPVIEWLISAEIGGSFNVDKVAFDNGAMFAIGDISKGELIMDVPRKAQLRPSKEEYEEHEDYNSEEDGYGLMCFTAKRLAYEYEVLKEKSGHWPYLQYVFESFDHAAIPIGWSPEGKELVHVMVDYDVLEPFDFGDTCFAGTTYAESCKHAADGEGSVLLEAAWRIVVSRGWNHVLVPSYDMINHRNGSWRNVDRDPMGGRANLEVDGEFRIIAIKDIPAGAQLYNSYNQCDYDATCNRNTGMVYMTQDIFQDYGFVEQYPRRFAFFTGYDHDEELGLVINIDEKTPGGGDLEVKWMTKRPSKLQLKWMVEQLALLTDKEMIDYLEKGVKLLTSEKEGRAVLEYYEALKEVLSLAIETVHPPQDDKGASNDDPLSDDDDFDDDDFDDFHEDEDRIFIEDEDGDDDFDDEDEDEDGDDDFDDEDEDEDGAGDEL
eukprot:CAMPEP_0194347092 /NCGR_PEP_ID=MMETSP0171-20130528/105796_1 /TAXON_ID=218684 /ORGANISM="Corethron pennatum, Strain L29A3" /LENGTH=459 /DNA_ID=CAMNT_0039114301 /DNA_START=95 /DNA_END=1474 /DNA_ORIENTATION=+